MSDPGPANYDIEGSFSYANDFRGKGVIDKAKQFSFCTTQAKLAISPGPAKLHHSIDTLNKISPTSIGANRMRL